MPHFFLRTDAFKIEEISMECLDAVEAYRHDDLVLTEQYADANSTEVSVTNYLSPNRNTSYLLF
jgi:hypothetical protein